MAKPSEYAARYRAIRKYVNFKVSKNPTPAQKGMISRYYKALKLYGVIGKVRPGVYVYKTASKERLKAAQSETMQDSGFPRLKVAIFQNVPEGAIKKARKVDGKWKFDTESQYLRSRLFLFKDYERFPGEFSTKPKAVIRRILKLCKGASDTRFKVGKYLERVTSRKPNAIMYAAERWIAKYGDENRDPENHWDQWWNGIEAIWYTKQRKTTSGGTQRGAQVKGKKARNRGLRNGSIPTR